MEKDKQWLLALGKSSDIILSLCMLARDLDQKFRDETNMPLKKAFEQNICFGQDIDTLIKSIDSDEFKHKISMLIYKIDGMIKICNTLDEVISNRVLIKNNIISIRNYLFQLQTEIQKN